MPPRIALRVLDCVSSENLWYIALPIVCDYYLTQALPAIWGIFSLHIIIFFLYRKKCVCFNIFFFWMSFAILEKVLFAVQRLGIRKIPCVASNVTSNVAWSCLFFMAVLNYVVISAVTKIFNLLVVISFVVKLKGYSHVYFGLLLWEIC